jgi:hypothetical protein
VLAKTVNAPTRKAVCPIEQPAARNLTLINPSPDRATVSYVTPRMSTELGKLRVSARSGIRAKRPKSGAVSFDLLVQEGSHATVE